MKKKTFLISLLLSSSFNYGIAYAQPPIPSGFEDLYQVTKKNVNIKDINGHYHQVQLLAGYDSLQLNSDSQEKLLRSILISNNINTSAVNDMISSLKSGVKNTLNCEGEISECVVTPDTYQFYYDYYSNKAYIYVNPELLIKNSSFLDDEIQYADPEKEDWAFINHFSAYSGFSNKGSETYSIYDRSVLGLTYGNISSDIYYQSSDSEFEINELLYNVEFNNYRMMAGLSRDKVQLNSTDFLNYGTLNKELAITIGTSKNLVIGNKNSSQKLFYFAPNDGVLTIYRGERIIMQRNVQAGQGYITNDELPSGRYSAVFEITSGGQMVSREIKNIYNSGSDTLAIGSFDSAISIGALENTFDRFSSNPVTDEDDYDLQGDLFFRTLLSYRVSEPLVLGLGTVSTGRDSALMFGLQAYLPFDSELTTTGQLFSQNGSYFDSTLSIQGWGVSYEQFNATDETVLGKYYYGDRSFEQASVSKGFRITQSMQGYLSYSLYDADSTYQFESYRSSILTMGMTMMPIGSTTLQLNVDYDFERDNRSDRFSTQLVWTIPFGQNLSAESRLSSRGQDINSWRNSVRADNLFKRIDGATGSAVVGHNYYPDAQDDQIIDGSINGSLNRSSYRANAYAYANDKGDYSGSINLSSTQIVSRKGVALTRDESNSYLVINSQDRLKNDDRQSGVKGLLVLESDARPTTKRMVTDNKEVIPLKDYDEYRAFLDTESVDLNNSGDSYAVAYTTPGTVKYLNTDVSRVISFISSFKDLFDNVISNVECDGTGCVSSDEVVNGVYKVSVKEGQAFKLVTDLLVCYIPPVGSAKMFNFGSNYCIPKVEPTEQFITRNGDDSIRLTFVGGFDLDEYKNIVKPRVMSITQQSEDNALIERVIGNYIYVYVSTDGSSLTAQQSNVIYDVQRYAKLDVLMDESHNYILVKM